MARRSKVDHPVIAEEDLDREIDSLATKVVDIVNQHRAEFGVQDNFRPTQELDDRLRNGLRAALESEVVAAVPTDHGRINEYEFEREIIKKALVGLTRHQLQMLAKERRVRVGGSSEELATRVADSFAWKRVEIAEAVMRYELATSTDRGHSTRVFSFVDEPSMEYVRERLSYVEGRYIKVGLARWFVFDEVTDSDDGVVLRGALRSFKAEVEQESDGSPVINHVGDRKEAMIEYAGGRLVRINESTAQGAKAGAEAFGQATNMPLLDWVPNGGSGVPAGAQGAVGMHPASEFVLDLVHNRMRDGRFSDVNLTNAKFQVGRDSDVPLADRKPEVKSVRFDGSYLIGSHSACVMLTVDKRALTDVSFQVEVRAKDGTDRGSYPVRISIDADHVLVATGHGTTGDVATSREVHQKAVAGVEQEILSGLGNEDRLADLVAELVGVAKRGTSPSRAVPLGG